MRQMLDMQSDINSHKAALDEVSRAIRGGEHVVRSSYPYNYKHVDLMCYTFRMMSWNDTRNQPRSS
jgi:hypothetical protein